VLGFHGLRFGWFIRIGCRTYLSKDGCQWDEEEKQDDDGAGCWAK